MHEARAASAAEPALRGVAGIAWARPQGHRIAGFLRGGRPHAGRGEDVCDAEGRGGLLAAFEAVADEDGHGRRLRGGEGYGAALAGDGGILG